MIGMKKLAIVLYFLLPPTLAQAQEKISGVVVGEKGGSPEAGVNVLLRELGKKSIIGYCITGEDGRYSITYKTEVDSLTLSVIGFNIRQQDTTIRRGSMEIDFMVAYERQQLREATVKADGIKRDNDTLSYYVSKFADPGDRAIGDVLKKLPGIEVTRKGAVLYNGKEINKLYIDGMDMLDGRYGIATNNIQAKDIAVVEVYEGHQPIKMLQNWVKSDRAAINLKLKEGAKGTWNGVIQLGAGYKPWLWNVEASPMYFGRDFQFIATLKSNDTGEDPSKELVSHFNAMDELDTRMHVTSPATPPVDEGRHLDNVTHAASVNAIKKLGEDSDLAADVRYIWWQDDRTGMSETTYHMPDGAELVVPESLSMTHRSDKLGANLQYRLNAKSSYIKEKLSFEGEKIADDGDVASSEAIGEKLDRPTVNFLNDFRFAKRMGASKIRLDISSDIAGNSLSSTFNVSPTPYWSELGFSAEGLDARQTFDQDRLVTKNRVSLSRMTDHWNTYITAYFNAEVSDIQSALYSMDETGTAVAAADSMHNDCRWHRLETAIEPSVFYNWPGSMVNLSIPVRYASYGGKDKLSGEEVSDGRWLVSPRFFLMAKLSPNLRTDASASWSESIGGMSDSYTGYILSGYRSLSSSDVRPVRTSSQNASADISYSNAYNALFISASGIWWRNVTDLTYGTEYIGDLLKTTVIRKDNETSGLSFNSRISKRFDAIATTVALNGRWDRSWADYLQQLAMMTVRQDMTSVGLTVDSRIRRAVTLHYSGTLGNSASRMSGMNLPKIRTFKQKATADFLLSKKFSCKVAGEHYYNSAISGDGRNMFFMDASVSYKAGRFEYLLEGRSLFNMKEFSSAYYTDNIGYVHRTALRPASVMLKVRFSVR